MIFFFLDQHYICYRTLYTMCWRTYTVFIQSRESCGRQSQKQVHKSVEGCRGRKKKKKKKKGCLISSLFSNNDAQMKGESGKTHLVRGYGANSEQGKGGKKSFELLQCKVENPQEYASALISLFKPVCQYVLHAFCCTLPAVCLCILNNMSLWHRLQRNPCTCCCGRFLKEEKIVYRVEFNTSSHRPTNLHASVRMKVISLCSATLSLFSNNNCK